MPADIAAQIESLHQLTTSELAKRYKDLHDQPTRTRHRAYLIRKIAWRMQANAEGDLTERARRRAAELADDAEVRVMAPKTLICPPQPAEKVTVNRLLPNGERNDPRLPAPGSAIIRQHKGRTIRVVVLADIEAPDLHGRVRRRGWKRLGHIPVDEHPVVDRPPHGGGRMTTVTRQIHFAVKGRRKRALPGPAPAPSEPQGRVPRVSKLMALAIHFDELIDKGVVANQSDLARLAHVTQPRMTQIMNLLHLASDIQEEILFLPMVVHGRDPITERDLRPITRKTKWELQRSMWLRWLTDGGHEVGDSAASLLLSMSSCSTGLMYTSAQMTAPRGPSHR